MNNRTVRAMSTADRRAWEAARTLADLGELTAQWLEGAIARSPLTRRAAARTPKLRR